MLESLGVRGGVNSHGVRTASQDLAKLLETIGESKM
jgi:hypothetical protein